MGAFLQSLLKTVGHATFPSIGQLLVLSAEETAMVSSSLNRRRVGWALRQSSSPSKTLTIPISLPASIIRPKRQETTQNRGLRTWGGQMADRERHLF